MSLPIFDSQGSLFGNITSLAPGLFSEADRYKLFAQKIWPILAGKRPQLESCYVTTNGRAAVEPVVLLGALLLQFMERAPDRQAADLVRYHLGWKLALNLDLGEGGFHATTLVKFRNRLEKNGQAKIAFNAVLEALQEEGLVPKRGRQRLDSTNVLGLVARMSRLECVRETLRLALEELAPALAELQRPDFWALLWERYVESKLDYKNPEAVLKQKQTQVGEDSLRLLRWLEPLPVSLRSGRQVELLRRVFEEHYTILENHEVTPVKEHAAGVVQNPHDPKRSGPQRGKAKPARTGSVIKCRSPRASAPNRRARTNRSDISSPRW